MTSSERPGPMLRRLRREREFTLRAAAEVLDVSASALSRLERELRPVERHDVNTVIRGYGLSHWETTELLLSAGFSPQVSASPDGTFPWPIVTEIVRAIALPTLVLDEFNYVVAWNGPMHTLAEWEETPGAPPHLLDGIFSYRGRSRLGEGWHETACAACWQFHMRTLRVAGDPRYSKALHAIVDRHGTEFIPIWNEALARGYAADWGAHARAHVTVSLATREGEIEFLVLRNMAHGELPIEIHVLMPVGDVARDRYNKLAVDADLDQVVDCRRLHLR